MKELRQDQKDQLKESFKQYLENKERIKDINELNKDIINSLKEILEVKPKEIRKAFSFLEEKQKENKDTLQEVVDISLIFEL